MQRARAILGRNRLQSCKRNENRQKDETSHIQPHALPVFSVHETDIIYYDHDLEDYLRHEFDLPGRKR
jgi:hypothetical protein